MVPRHFWWLIETLQAERPGAHITDEERAELLAMLDDANHGAV
jgi:hypothetical protein